MSVFCYIMAFIGFLCWLALGLVVLMKIREWWDGYEVEKPKKPSRWHSGESAGT